MHGIETTLFFFIHKKQIQSPLLLANSVVKWWNDRTLCALTRILVSVGTRCVLSCEKRDAFV
jgi:hypothetical protein